MFWHSASVWSGPEQSTARSLSDVYVIQNGISRYEGSRVAREMLDVGRKYVNVRYLPSNLDQSELAFSAMVKAVESSVLKYDPQVVIGINDDYQRYMSTSFLSRMRDRYVRLARNNATYPELMSNTLADLLIVNKLSSRRVYLLHDSTRASLGMAITFSDRLTKYGIQSQTIEVETVPELRARIISLDSEQPSVIVNLIGIIPDTEFGTFWYHEETSTFISKNNNKHLDVGLSYADTNLAVVLGLDIVSLDRTASPPRIESKSTVTANTQRLRSLGLGYVYSNSFSLISGVIP